MEGRKRAPRKKRESHATQSEDVVVLGSNLTRVDARPEDDASLQSIVYTETQVITVDPAHFEDSRIIVDAPESAAARAYRLLRTQMLERMEHESWQSVAVVSPSAREGKTLTAINVGIALASSLQYTVMLVDCDWRRPSTHAYFDFEPEQDIISALEDEVPLSSIIVNPSIPRFCFIPCSRPVANSAEKLRGGAVRALADELRTRYANRIVLYDLPPLLVTDDALSFLPNVDSVLLVVEENRTQREELERAVELIGAERLLGTVVNRSHQRLPEY